MILNLLTLFICGSLPEQMTSRPGSTTTQFMLELQFHYRNIAGNLKKNKKSRDFFMRKKRVVYRFLAGGWRYLSAI